MVSRPDPAAGGAATGSPDPAPRTATASQVGIAGGAFAVLIDPAGAGELGAASGGAYLWVVRPKVGPLAHSPHPFDRHVGWTVKRIPGGAAVIEARVTGRLELGGETVVIASVSAAFADVAELVRCLRELADQAAKSWPEWVTA